MATLLAQRVPAAGKKYFVYWGTYTTSLPRFANGESKGIYVSQFHSETGKPRTRLIVTGDGTSSLEFMDSGDRVRVLLGVRDNGSPRLWLGNDAGKIIWRAP